jgi:abequosyltransferase
MDSPVTLSICIPTHHGRGIFLKQAIESILSQVSIELRNRVEICISDNASEDGTQHMVEQFSRAYPGLIVYQRNAQDLGWKANIRQAIGLAKGEYCWFLSSDDALSGTAIVTVLRLLEQNSGITGISVNRANYDRGMQGYAHPDAELLFPEDCANPHIYSSAHAIISNLGLYWTYFSGQIFKRAHWQRIVEKEDSEALKFFSHLYFLGRMVQENPYWVWCPERLVKNRTGNDAVIHDLRWHLYKYRLETMEDVLCVWSALLGSHHSVFKSLCHRGRRLWWGIDELWYRSKREPGLTLRDDWAMLVGYVRNLYFLPEFWIKTFPVLLVPHFLLSK